jgi:solute carrier family 50 protein (sugar transporter)
MAIVDTIRLVVGIIGNIISVFLFLSPVPTFVNVWKWKSTRGYSGFPYPMTLLNCALWVLYGMPFVHPHSILVVTVNGAGVLFEAVYTIFFLIFCKDKNEKRRVVGLLALIFVFFAAVASLSLTLEHTHKRRTLVIGTICIVFNVFMYASPLSIMKKVIQTKSVKYMPFYLSLGCFANGLIWAVYGCIHFDINLVLPNGLGSLLGACQLILYGVYYGSTRWNEEDEEKESSRPDKNGNSNSQAMKNLSGAGHGDNVDRNGIP